MPHTVHWTYMTWYNAHTNYVRFRSLKGLIPALGSEWSFAKLNVPDSDCIATFSETNSSFSGVFFGLKE